MKKFFSKKGLIILAVAVVIALISGIALSHGNRTGFVTGTADTALSPVKSLAASIAKTCEKLYGYMHDYDRLMEENALLKSQVAGANQEAREYEKLEQENRRLKELLGFATYHSDFVFDVASIMSWSSSNWESTFTINKGSSNSDVEAGDSVVTSSGEVVGVVKTVSENSCVCASVIDPSFSVSVQLDNVGGAAAAQGNYSLMKDGLLSLDYINDLNYVLIGDSIVTSGKGGVFPEGLLVGYVMDICAKPTGYGEYAKVSPAADLSNVFDVFIITDFGSLE